MKSSIIKVIIIIFSLISSSHITYAGNETSELAKIVVEGKEYYVYDVKRGESLYGIAKKFDWDIQELLKFNPNASGALQKGRKIYYPADYTNDTNSLNTLTSENSLKHTVKKGETIYSIANQYNVPLKILYSYNPSSMKGIKAGEILIIPSGSSNPDRVKNEDITFNDKVHKENEITNEKNDFSLSEITEEIIEEDTIRFEGIKVALILDEPNSNKDIDFTRGLLLSLDGMTDTPYKIDLKVMEGGISSSDITQELDDYEAEIIISTADKNFPLFLAGYGNSNNVPIINVFDLKTDLFEDNTSLVQILPPTVYFYENIASEIFRLNRHRKLIGVGTPDDNDGFETELFKIFGEDSESLSLEEFGSMEPDIMEPVLIYSYASKKEDVYDFLNNIEHLSNNFPGFDFHIIGRSSWIAMIDEFGDKFEKFSVSIPARAWVNEETEEWKNFSNNYERLFKNTPVKSIPNFAASGYDVGNYIINMAFENQGDFEDLTNTAIKQGLQNDIKLNRINDRGGYLNNIGYLIKFNPEGSKEKLMVK